MECSESFPPGFHKVTILRSGRSASAYTGTSPTPGHPVTFPRFSLRLARVGPTTTLVQT